MHRDDFVGENVEGRLRAWLHKVVVSKTNDALRRIARSRYEAMEGREYELIDELEGMDAEAAELQEWMDAQLEKVRVGNEVNYRLLCEHYLHARSCKELAREWNLTVKAVECRIGRALLKLRDLTEDDLGLGEAAI